MVLDEKIALEAPEPDDREGDGRGERGTDWNEREYVHDTCGANKGRLRRSSGSKMKLFT